MSLAHPLWLLAFPVAAAIVLVVARTGRPPLGAARNRSAVIVRLVLVAIIALALAGPRFDAAGNRVAVVFLVDRSHSVGAAGEEHAVRFITEALAARRGDALAAVVAFGREPRLEFSMTDSPQMAGLSAAPDPAASDLAGALRLAEGLFPEGTKRRVVILSDGLETSGDAAAEAERLERAGITIDAVLLERPAGGDPMIERIDAPALAHAGESYRIGVVMHGTGRTARLDVYRDGALIDRRELTLPSGRTTVVLDERAEGAGLRRYDARLVDPGDPVPENNRGIAAVEIAGPPRVLLVEGAPEDGHAIARALRAGGMRVERVSPDRLPDLAGLVAYESVVLANVPVTELTNVQVDALHAAVREGGMGLVTIGGERAYALGAYLGSALEDLLPVESEIKDPRRRPTVAEALVIDNSGSMAESASGGFGGGGDTRIDVARAGAARALRALRPTDYAGVLAFNTGSRWVIPMQKLPSDEDARQALSSMVADGGTDIAQAIHAAIDALRSVEAKVKHIVLFTDGESEPNAMIEASRRAAREKITITAVETGGGARSTLQQVARIGGGRHYPGASVNDVPEIMVQESILASRTIVNEGVFRPRITARTPFTASLTRTPAILGYLGTSARSTATVELEIGKEDPLLARWRAGLGTVVSWTSDAKARWSRPWIGWDGYRDFWTGVVRSTFAPSLGGAGAVEVRIVGDRLHVDARGSRAFAPGATADIRVVAPSLQAFDVPLERAGADLFRGDVAAREPGTYLTVVTVRDDTGTVLRARAAATIAYSAEYTAEASDAALMRQLATITAGRVDPDPALAFDPAGLRASRSGKELWPLLAVLAALLLPVDIAARRLVVTRDDLRAALARRRRAGGDDGTTAARDDSIERLVSARRGGGEQPPENP